MGGLRRGPVGCLRRWTLLSGRWRWKSGYLLVIMGGLGGRVRECDAAGDQAPERVLG